MAYERNEKIKRYREQKDITYGLEVKADLNDLEEENADDDDGLDEIKEEGMIYFCD